MHTKKTLEGELKKLSEELFLRKKECEIKGHKNMLDFQYIITIKSKHDDEVNMYCNYCLTFSKRKLNSLEHEEIERFYKSLNEPVTI